MTTDKDPKVSGTIIRGADGSLYFIRDEVIQACKVTEPEMAAFCQKLVEEHKGDTSGFTLTAGAIKSTLPLQGPFKGGVNPLGTAASTVMCPGTMGLADFHVLPARKY
jgi:hypothetical protein